MCLGDTRSFAWITLKIKNSSTTIETVSLMPTWQSYAFKSNNMPSGEIRNPSLSWLRYLDDEIFLHSSRWRFENATQTNKGILQMESAVVTFCCTKPRRMLIVQQRGDARRRGSPLSPRGHPVPSETPANGKTALTLHWSDNWGISFRSSRAREFSSSVSRTVVWENRWGKRLRWKEI